MLLPFSLLSIPISSSKYFQFISEISLGKLDKFFQFFIVPNCSNASSSKSKFKLFDKIVIMSCGMSKNDDERKRKWPLVLYGLESCNPKSKYLKKNKQND